MVRAGKVVVKPKSAAKIETQLVNLPFCRGAVALASGEVDEVVSVIVIPEAAVTECEHENYDMFSLAKWCLDCGAVQDGEDNLWLTPRILRKQ